MSRAFAWIMLVIAAAMLLLQLGVAEKPQIGTVALWVLVAFACVYSLFLKKPKDKPTT